MKNILLTFCISVLSSTTTVNAQHRGTPTFNEIFNTCMSNSQAKFVECAQIATGEIGGAEMRVEQEFDLTNGDADLTRGKVVVCKVPGGCTKYICYPDYELNQSVCSSGSSCTPGSILFPC